MHTTPSQDTIISELLQVWNDFGVQTPTHVASVTKKPQSKPKPTPEVSKLNIAAYKKPIDAQIQALDLCKSAKSIEHLKEIIASFDGIAIKKGANKLVFGDGNLDARIMVIGDAPGREEDAQGVPFLGPAGKLLDKMLSSIGITRQTNAYLTYCVNWRPPGSRGPTRDELGLSAPFIKRHIELFAPKLLILFGDAAAATILETTDGIAKLRRKSHDLHIEGQKDPVKVYCTFHPAHLLARPADKALAWKDLLNIAEQNQDLLNN